MVSLTSRQKPLKVKTAAGVVQEDVAGIVQVERQVVERGRPRVGIVSRIQIDGITARHVEWFRIRGVAEQEVFA